MAEITWRTVTAPSQGSANQLGAQGLQTLLAGISNLGETLQKPLKEDERKQKEAFNQAIQLAGLDQGQQRIDNQNSQFGTTMDFKESEATRSQGNIEDAAEAKVLAAKQGYTWDKLTAKQKNEWQVEATKINNQNQVARDITKMGFQTKEREASQTYNSTEKGKDRAAAKARNDASIAARPQELSPEAKAKAALKTFEEKEKIKAKYAKKGKPSDSGSLQTNAAVGAAYIKHYKLSGDEAIGMLRVVAEADAQGVTPKELTDKMPDYYSSGLAGIGPDKLENFGRGSDVGIKKPNQSKIKEGVKAAKEVNTRLKALQKAANNNKNINRSVKIPN